MNAPLLGLVFDMDGVLVDSESHWRNVASEFLQGLVPGWSKTDQQGILGMSAVDVHRKLVQSYGLNISLQEYIAYYDGLSAEIYGRRAAAIPGVGRFIADAVQCGLLLAVASSSPRSWIEIVVNRFGWQEYFSVLASSEDVGGKGKPAPDIYQFAVGRLELAPHSCLAFEDSARGLQSARAAGLRCMSVGASEELERGVSGSIADFTELRVESLLEA